MAMTRAEVLNLAKVSLDHRFVVPRYDIVAQADEVSSKQMDENRCEVVSLVNLHPYSLESQHLRGVSENAEFFKQDARGRGFLTRRLAVPADYQSVGIPDDGTLKYIYRVVPASMFVASEHEMKGEWDKQARIKAREKEIAEKRERMRQDADLQAIEVKNKTVARVHKILVSMFGEKAIGSKVWTQLEARKDWDDITESFKITPQGTISMELEQFETLAYQFVEWQQSNRKDSEVS